MDQYGSFTTSKDDIAEIKAAFEQHGDIVFPFSGDQIGSMILHISRRFIKLGIMPFGGNPNGRVYLGVYGRGCNHFSQDKIHFSYFVEKLKISQEEGEWLEKLWEGLF